jgi:hypothetical protein
MGRRTGVAVALASLIAGSHGGAAGAEEQPSERVAVWLGFDASIDSQYGYAGAAYALGDSIDANGFLVRLGLGGGQYETRGSDSHWVDHYDVDLMAGYHVGFGGASLSAYVGGDFKDHRNDDPESDIRGERFGVKGQIEAYAPLGERFFAAGFANYSTVFDTFDASAKFEYRVSQSLSVGPEAAVLGCQGFDQVRAGLAMAWRLGAVELAPNAGAAWRLDDNEFGFYTGLNIYRRF